MFPFFLHDRFGYDAQHVAALFVGIAIVMGGVQGGAMKSLSARFEERALVTGGALVLGLAFLAMPSMPTIGLLLVPLVFSAVGRGVSQPALMSLVSFAATPRNRGAVMGVYQSSASLARVVGPTVVGLLYDANLAWPFWLAGALTLGVASLRRFLPGRETAPDPAARELSA
jgi:MFS family permease